MAVVGKAARSRPRNGWSEVYTVSARSATGRSPAATAAASSTLERGLTCPGRSRHAAEQIVALINKTLAFLDLRALGPVLKARLMAAANALIAGNKTAACTALNLYKAAVQAAPRSALSALEKSRLVAAANRIRAVIGCA